MFKPRQQRAGRNQQPQNPISDMEQFYLHQYFGPQAGSPPTPPPMKHPYATDVAHPSPYLELEKLQQLELRIARIEQSLGFFPTKPPVDPRIR
ncbi:MAG: hypothetical protein FWG67_01730 [Defluviitaleaceae bacterium]|nr:hypothetical protein [Defluviitaleaceae bacterium]